MTGAAVHLARPVSEGTIEAIASVAAFLAFLEREKGRTFMYGGRTVAEAIEGLAFIVGTKPDTIREISGIDD